MSKEITLPILVALLASAGVIVYAHYHPNFGGSPAATITTCVIVSVICLVPVIYSNIRRLRAKK